MKHPRPPVAPSRGLGIEHFNRGVGTALSLLLLIGGLAAALVAGGVLEPGTAVPAGWLRERLTDLRDASGSVRTDIAFGAAACAALGAILLVSELRPLSEPRYIQSADGSEREFAVRKDVVERMVAHAGRQVPGVLAMESIGVSRELHAVDIACCAVLHPDVPARALAPFLEAHIRNSVYTMTGLPVGRVHLRARHGERRLLAVPSGGSGPQS
ncbi:MAG: hypothetical protein E6J42_01865 [Chloroflexi bacterium]|nr:MAG: hypothetical protein E6J42_01865 [Chloroflexota bacterium]